MNNPGAAKFATRSDLRHTACLVSLQLDCIYELSYLTYYLLDLVIWNKKFSKIKHLHIIFSWIQSTFHIWGNFRCNVIEATLVTHPMLQLRPNCMELRSMDLFNQILCWFQKCKQKDPPPSLPPFENKKVGVFCWFFLKVFAHLSLQICPKWLSKGLKKLKI